MTSVLRNFSQIPVREKFLLAVTDGSANQISAFEMSAGEYLSITSVTEFVDVSGADGYAYYPITSGSLFKDMGRQITIYDPADHKHLSVYRQVQLVSGSASEGVNTDGNTPESYNANIFVKVWSADGLGVVVVRTG